MKSLMSFLGILKELACRLFNLFIGVWKC